MSLHNNFLFCECASFLLDWCNPTTNSVPSVEFDLFDYVDDADGTVGTHAFIERGGRSSFLLMFFFVAQH